MAAITSAATGLSNVGTTWVGGVVPVEGDNVTIAVGHAVTITGTHIWGNDTATAALTLAGSCVFSTTVNTSLTLKGTLVNSGTAAVWRRGTIASPMPAGITSVVITNYSAVLANNKYNISFGASTRFAEWSEVGATRNRQFYVAAAIAAGATSITVSDATGWAVGNIIFLESTNTTAAQREHRVLTSVAGNVVGWTTGLVNARLAGAWGGNLSSNVLWQSFSGSFGAYVQVICQTTQAAATINIKQVSYHGMYGQNDVSGFAIGGTNAVTVANSPVGVVDNIAACDLLPDGTNAAGANALLGVRLGYAGSWTYPTVYSRQGYNTGLNALYTSSGGTGYFTNAFFCGVYGIIFSQFSQGGVGCKVVNSRITNNNNINTGASMIGFSMDSVTMDGSNSLLAILQGDYTFNNCLFGQTYGFLNTTQLISNSNNSLSTLTFNSCLLPATPVVLPSTYQNALVNKPVTILNKNADSTQQEIYLNTGSIIRDNAQLFRSRSSIKFSPYIANTAHGYAFQVSASAGLACTFRFGLRYDTTYGTATPPTVTVSGLGITPGTFTAGGSANTDYSGTFTVTPVSTGLLTITISGQTTATLGTGSYWFNGMSVNPWIDWTQWYGYAYLPSTATLTVDSVVVLSEASAEALTGLSLASGTLTVSGARTVSNCYDWLKWYEASNRLAPIITSADGKNFILSTNLAVSGALTIPSGSTLIPSGTFTLTGSLSGAVTANVSQATPTALTGVTITGNLTFNTNSSATITLTNCTITGTVSNSGTGAIQVNRSNTTIGTVGANVTSVLVTSLTLTGLTNGSQVYIANGSGSQIEYVPSSGTSYGINTTGGTGTFSYKVARFGFITATGTFTPATASFTFAINLIPDINVIEPLEVVEAYTALTTAQEIYDYISYYNTTNPGIANSIAAVKSFGAIDFLSSNVTLNPSAASVMAGTTTLTLKTSGLVGEDIYYSTGNFTLGAATLSTDTKIRMANLNSELVFIGVSNIDLYSTESDRNNRDNLRMSITTSPYRFLYGATVNSVLFQTILYSETTASVQYEYNISLNSGNNVLALDATTLLLSINNTLLEEKTLVEAIKKNTALISALL